ncbi:MAG: HAD-IC family P-type ATPase [Acidimicrobiales bacterium]
MEATTTAAGLSSQDVEERIAAGQDNRSPEGTSRSNRQIVVANVFNPVNAIMLSLFVLILIAGYPEDGLFVGVVISNSVIGITQELYARRELHKLELLNAPLARVKRNGEVVEVATENVVKDDLVVLAPGDQISVDGAVITSAGLEVDESLLTGEADPIDKDPGDEILSGSFVNAGSGQYIATRVGAESYANTLAAEAKRFVLVDSELRKGINTILRVLIVIIPPVGLLLLWSLLDVEDRWQDALQGTVAAAVAMVPDGLVLLTSLAFVAGVITLARRQALAKELATVELLARVDTLCLDKTGTITTGEIGFGEVRALSPIDEKLAFDALGAFAASDPSPNPTLTAVVNSVPAPSGWEVVATEPFSSARKWSATQFVDRGTYFFGAPDILFSDRDEEARVAAQTEAAAGRRVLLLVHSEEPLNGDLAEQRTPVALVLLEDTVRDDAEEIFGYFTDQGVELKVISGDNVATVSAVAARAGIPHADASLDATELPEGEPELAEVMADKSVFGRVTPHQKRAMVAALQGRGRVVAMTGDGVNDVLALKDADMGIAMGSGTAASRGVAQLVLLDNRFATLPEVLAQGRKVINNIERVSNLFVTKAAYAVLLTAIIAIQGIEFPFLPRHLTLIGSLTIGIPGVFLALAPNTNLVRPGFLNRVLRFSVPAGAIAGTATWLVYLYARSLGGDPLSDSELADARSAATITLLGIGLVVLIVVSRPLRAWKVALAGAMAGLYALVLVWEPARDFFELTTLDQELAIAVAVAILAGGLMVIAIPIVVPGTRMARSTNEPAPRASREDQEDG